jgi:hypothetical protein
MSDFRGSDFSGVSQNDKRTTSADQPDEFTLLSVLADIRQKNRYRR